MAIPNNYDSISQSIFQSSKEVDQLVTEDVKSKNTEEKVTAISNKINALKDRKTELENDVTWLSKHYDEGSFWGFIHKILSFFFGSPLETAQKHIKTIDEELDQLAGDPIGKIVLLREYYGSMKEQELEQVVKQITASVEEQPNSIQNLYFDGGPLDENMENRGRRLLNTALSLESFKLVYPDDKIKLTGDLIQDEALVEHLAEGVWLDDIERTFEKHLEFTVPRDVVPKTLEREEKEKFQKLIKIIINEKNVYDYENILEENRRNAPDQLNFYKTINKHLEQFEKDKIVNLKFRNEEQFESFIKQLIDDRDHLKIERWVVTNKLGLPELQKFEEETKEHPLG